MSESASASESSEVFDLFVVGGGPAGYVAAIRASQLGMRVALAESRATLGGTCLNVGCIPSKALLDSSELYHLAKHRFERHGIKLSGVELDLAGMMKRKDEVVSGLTRGIDGLFKKNKIQRLHGRARLGGEDRVIVRAADGSETTHRARHILLAAGSEPTPLPFLPFDGRVVVSSTEALAFDAVPENLVVVGGGYIGLELGSVWKRLGSRVTVVEFLPRIVPMVDREIGDGLFRSLRNQGLEFHLETKVTGATIDAEAGRAVVHAETKDGSRLDLPADKILVSVGRRPMVEDLGLEAAGVAFDPKTRKILVDPHTYRTTAPNVSAIGDLVDGPMLAHKAEEEGAAVAEILAGKPGHVNYDCIPSVIYTWPEMAAVGLTEEQARERGREVRVGVFPIAANGRAKAMDETEGKVKVVADARTDRLLGVHILAPRASDMIAEAVAVMEFAGSAEDVARICHAHPTLSEAFKEAALAVDRRAIHF